MIWLAFIIGFVSIFGLVIAVIQAVEGKSQTQLKWTLWVAKIIVFTGGLMVTTLYLLAQ